MKLRQLQPGEEPTGVHTIRTGGFDGAGLVPELRYDCPCQWCEIWRAALPMIDQAYRDLEPEHRPDWLGG